VIITQEKYSDNSEAEAEKGGERMSFYEICTIILISGLTAHIVGCYEIVRMGKMIEQLMNEYAEEIQKIVQEFLQKKF